MMRHVEVGSKLMLSSDMPNSAAVVHTYDPEQLQVRADVPLADAAKVGVGMEAEVIVSVLPDRVFRGRVTRVVNEADVARNTLQVKVAILDPDPLLKPEMLARVRFLTPASQSGGGAAGAQAASLAPFIPESLIVQDGGADAVLIVDRATSTAVLRPIEPGAARKDGWIEVAAGLAAGDLLIADTSIRDGKRIRVIGEAELGQAGEAQREQGGNDGVH